MHCHECKEQVLHLSGLHLLFSLLYHELAVHDLDLHMLRMAVLLYLEKRLFTILFEKFMI